MRAGVGQAVTGHDAVQAAAADPVINIPFVLLEIDKFDAGFVEISPDAIDAKTHRCFAGCRRIENGLRLFAGARGEPRDCGKATKERDGNQSALHHR